MPVDSTVDPETTTLYVGVVKSDNAKSLPSPLDRLDPARATDDVFSDQDLVPYTIHHRQFEGEPWVRVTIAMTLTPLSVAGSVNNS